MSTPQALTDLPELSLHDFESASRAVLDFLHKRLGFGLWMVTRNVGDEWIVLQAENHGYNVKRGDVFNWTDSLCSVMVRSEGPRMVPDSEKVPAYAQAPLKGQLPINAYIGVPLTSNDGSVFGTLCALDPDPQSQTIVMEQPLIELLAALLSSVLKLELSALEAQRRNERLEIDAQVDSLTKASNRRSWDQMITKEEERCLRYGHSAAIVVVDVDGLKAINDSGGKAAGDDMLLRVADALRAATREVDLVARLGDDEFGVLAVECNDVGSRSLLKRMRQTLDKRGLKVSIGIAVRHPTGGLNTAWEMAERRMYEEKRAAAED